MALCRIGWIQHDILYNDVYEQLQDNHSRLMWSSYKQNPLLLITSVGQALVNVAGYPECINDTDEVQNWQVHVAGYEIVLFLFLS